MEEFQNQQREVRRLENECLTRPDMRGCREEAAKRIQWFVNPSSEIMARR
jgi:hypothetical protein